MSKSIPKKQQQQQVKKNGSQKNVTGTKPDTKGKSPMQNDKVALHRFC